MIKAWFQCVKCTHKFEEEILEPGEAERERVPVGPVRCPRCKTDAVQRLDNRNRDLFVQM